MQILWQKKVICRTISTLFMKGTKITNVNLVANHLLLRGYSLYCRPSDLYLIIKDQGVSSEGVCIRSSSY